MSDGGYNFTNLEREGMRMQNRRRLRKSREAFSEGNLTCETYTHDLSPLSPAMLRAYDWATRSECHHCSAV